MVSPIVILVTPGGHGSGEISWEKLGTVVTELAELYQLVKETRIDIVLVDEDRIDITPAVATRIRRYNPLVDIWRFSNQQRDPDDHEKYIDGHVSTEYGQAGVRDKIRQILDDKRLLERYGFVGRSPQLRQIAHTIQRIAPTDASVLIVGPSGSGKELTARALHKDSRRSDHPFVAINCGALAEGVLESELFGHERGAFTGSVAKREGLFHKADGGTIFLDEIGETTQNMQVKLLRVLEDGTYYPVGSSSPRRVDVRVVAATNRDLTEAIAERHFREDLYFRIGVVKIILPPLLERPQDIQPLLHHFWEGGREPNYSDSALNLLMRYDWPGNVRQLRNFVTRMTALKPSGLVEAVDVERFIAEQHAGGTNLPVSTGRTVEEAGQELIYRAIVQLGNEVRLLRDLITAHLPDESSGTRGEGEQTVPPENATMDDMERMLIEQTLAATGGNRKETARRLGIGERTLYRKISKYRLN